jgi:uncharacterized protein YjbI with pentapeptide repeats
MMDWRVEFFDSWGKHGIWDRIQDSYLKNISQRSNSNLIDSYLRNLHLKDSYLDNISQRSNSNLTDSCLRNLHLKDTYFDNISQRSNSNLTDSYLRNSHLKDSYLINESILQNHISITLILKARILATWIFRINISMTCNSKTCVSLTFFS